MAHVRTLTGVRSAVVVAHGTLLERFTTQITGKVSSIFMHGPQMSQQRVVEFELLGTEMTNVRRGIAHMGKHVSREAFHRAESLAAMSAGTLVSVHEIRNNRHQHLYWLEFNFGFFLWYFLRTGTFTWSSPGA